VPATLQLHYFPGNASLAPHLLLEDSYLLMLGRWTRGFARPARSLPQLGPYLARALARGRR